jgi:hypothetical protein
MKWLTQEQERVLRTRSTSPGDAAIVRELEERGIVKISYTPCRCHQLPFEHLHPEVDFTDRGEIVLTILEIMTHMRWTQ